MQEYHDSKVAGHFAEERMLNLMQQRVYWPNMAAGIKLFVKTCDLCQRSKKGHAKPQGLLQPLPVPSQRWEHIAIDVVGPLPPSKGFTAIAVVVDLFTKRVSLAPTRHDVTARDMANLLFDTCFKERGLPRVITGDRDSKWTSAFWAGLLARMGTTMELTTAYHQSADGQVERTVQTLKTWLTTYVEYARDTWADDLAIAELSLNTQKSATTGMSPFFMETGREPRLPFDFVAMAPGTAGRVEQVEQFLARMSSIAERGRAASIRAKGHQKQSADKHRRPPDTHAAGDLVMVKSELFTVDKSGEVGDKTALAKPWCGPYRVIAPMGRDNYKLDLLGSHKHDIFYVDKLKRYHESPATLIGRTKPPGPVKDYPDHYVVREIIDRRGDDQHRQYKVMWEGYAWDQATWEPLSNLTNVQAEIDAFNASYLGDATSTPAREKRKGERQPDPTSRRSMDKLRKLSAEGYRARLRSTGVSGEAMTDASIEISMLRAQHAAPTQHTLGWWEG